MASKCDDAIGDMVLNEKLNVVINIDNEITEDE